MELDKAIELLEEEARSPRYKFDPDKVAGFRLGIEALKRVKAGRPAPPSLAFLPLTGETRD